MKPSDARGAANGRRGSLEAPVDGLRRRATAGAVKAGLAQCVRMLTQFAAVIVLSRLLPPSAFGVAAMAGPIVMFAALFQDLGLTQAVVQKKQVTQGEMSALFAVSMALAAGIALLLLAIGPLVGWFYAEPLAGALTAAMGVNVVVGGMGSLSYALMNRRMQFGALAAIDAASAVGGLLVAVAVAWVWPDVWALYAGGVASCVIPTLGYWWLGGWRPSLPRRGSGVGAALRVGGDVTGFNVANFIGRNLDNVLIGQAWGEGPLGLYDRAYKLLLLPVQQINNPLGKIMLPVLSQLAGDPARYAHAFLRTLSQVLLLTLPGIAWMVGTSDVLVPLLLGAQWADASAIFAVLGLAGFLQVLNNPTGWLFVSQGRTRDYMMWGPFASATAVASFVLGLPYGAQGVATAYALSECVRTPVLWWVVTRRGPVRARAVFRVAVPHFAGAVASLGCVRLLPAALPDGGVPFLAAGLAIAFAASILVVALFPRGRVTLREAFALAQGLAGRARLP